MSYFDPFGRLHYYPPSSVAFGGTPAGSFAGYQRNPNESSTLAHDHAAYPSYGNADTASGSGYHYPQSYEADGHSSPSPYKEFSYGDNPPAPSGDFAHAEHFPVSGSLAESEAVRHNEAGVANSVPRAWVSNPAYTPFMELARSFAGTGVPTADLLHIFNKGKSSSQRLTHAKAQKWIKAYNDVNPSNPIGGLRHYVTQLRMQFLDMALKLQSSSTTEIVELFNKHFPHDPPVTVKAADGWLRAWREGQ